MKPEDFVPDLQSPKKIGIYGGSFSPPHIGHALAILYSMAMNDLDQVWVIPCGEHPHGKKLVEFGHRYQMAKSAFSRVRYCKVLPLEHYLPKPSFTNDTLKFIRDVQPNADLHLIVGEDVFKDIPSWEGGEKTMALAKLVPVPRSGMDNEGHLLPDISSTEIRASLQAHRPVERHLDFAVRRYITKHRLYQGEFEVKDDTPE
jgi:nicotinate-nucleotide adenylyltransferase